MQNILEFLDTKYIDWTIFILVIASGYFQKRFLRPFKWVKSDSSYDQTIKTFSVSLILCAVYIWLYKYEANGATEIDKKEAIPLIKFFISFGLATSFYDIIVKLFEKVFKEKTGVDAGQQ